MEPIENTTPEKFNLEKVLDVVENDNKNPVLTDEEVNSAKQSLVIQYPKIKRHIIDPPLKHKCKKQKYGMFSWYPSKTAKPDINGIYGVIILRGSFETAEDAEKRAEFLIKNEDSKHEFFIAEVGSEKPLCLDNKYARDVKIVETKVDEAKKEQDDEYKKETDKTRKEIEKRKQELEDDVKRNPDEINLDYYITQLVKMSNINQRLNEQKAEMKKCLDIIKSTKKTVLDIEKDHPEYRTTFIDKMKATFEERGIPVDIEKLKNNFDDILKNIMS
jgi:hypothetical protein